MKLIIVKEKNTGRIFVELIDFPILFGNDKLFFDGKQPKRTYLDRVYEVDTVPSRIVKRYTTHKDRKYVLKEKYQDLATVEKEYSYDEFVHCPEDERGLYRYVFREEIMDEELEIDKKEYYIVNSLDAYGYRFGWSLGDIIKKPLILSFVESKVFDEIELCLKYPLYLHDDEIKGWDNLTEDEWDNILKEQPQFSKYRKGVDEYEED